MALAIVCRYSTQKVLSNKSINSSSSHCNCQSINEQIIKKRRRRSRTATRECNLSLQIGNGSEPPSSQRERGYQFQAPSGSFLMRGDIARACIIMHDPREGAPSLRPAACCCPAALPSNRKFLHLSHQSASATDPTTAPARCWLMPTRRCLF